MTRNLLAALMQCVNLRRIPATKGNLLAWGRSLKRWGTGKDKTDIDI